MHDDESVRRDLSVEGESRSQEPQALVPVCAFEVTIMPCIGLGLISPMALRGQRKIVNKQNSGEFEAPDAFEPRR